MSLEEGFKRMLEGLRLIDEGRSVADEGRDEILHGLETAWAEGKTFHQQLAELRETVTRFESMILELAAEIRELRRARNGDEGKGA